MKTVAAVLEYVGPIHSEFSGAVIFKTSMNLPNGKNFIVEFKKDGNGRYTAEVPMVVTYFDEFRKKEAVFKENYAKELLESYGPKATNPSNRVLKFVKEVKKAEVEEVVFEQPVPIAEETKPKKEGKKNES